MNLEHLLLTCRGPGSKGPFRNLKMIMKNLSDTCAICNSSLEAVIDLPHLPLTGVYTEKSQSIQLKSFDQAFMMCNRCGHGQLQQIIDQDYLYGQTYGFRTSISKTATTGALFFAKYLKKLFGNRQFERILEFGCNDGVLLNLLKDQAKVLFGIDPILKGSESELNSGNIRVIGEKIENLNLREAIGGTPDLVVSQHTMEHLPDPRAILTEMLKLGNQNTLYVFEFPCFDLLFEQYRFDQIFHQHLHYYSFSSFNRLLSELGAELVDSTLHYTYWGAMLVTFKKTIGKQPSSQESFPKKTPNAIRKRYQLFTTQMQSAALALESIPKERLFGYGAALMLPILGYHLKTDFKGFTAILDDDPKKNGLGYPNLEVQIRTPEGLDLSQLSICLTAMDNRRPILKTLVDKSPRQIINPMCMI